MAHKTLVDGTAYNIKNGKCLVDGTAYSVKKGRTLVDGTGYDVKIAGVCKITLSGGSWYMGAETALHRYVVIDGEKYYGAGTEIEVPAGTTVAIDMYSNNSRKHEIWKNGYSMFSSTFTGRKTYDFVVDTDTEISCSQSTSGYTFDITTEG